MTSQSNRPQLNVAVVMRRERIDGPMSRWQPWRWVLADVVMDEPGFGVSPRLLYKNDSEEHWLHPGFTVELFKDDAEGYYLNITTEAPCWFVLWRMEEEVEPESNPHAPPLRGSLPPEGAGFAWGGPALQPNPHAPPLQPSHEPMAIPVMVSLSYQDAGRWLDAQETVEQVPAPVQVIEWLQAFVDEYHVQEAKRRRRPESFRSLTDRFGNPASISTDKNKKGGTHD